jgi:hypothetical protein
MTEGKGVSKRSLFIPNGLSNYVLLPFPTLVYEYSYSLFRTLLNVNNKRRKTNSNSMAPGALWLESFINPDESQRGRRWQQATRALYNMVRDKMFVTTLARLVLIRYCFRVSPTTPAMRALGLHFKFPSSPSFGTALFLSNLIMKLYLSAMILNLSS